MNNVFTIEEVSHMGPNSYVKLVESERPAYNAGSWHEDEPPMKQVASVNLCNEGLDQYTREELEQIISTLANTIARVVRENKITY